MAGVLGFHPLTQPSIRARARFFAREGCGFLPATVALSRGRDRLTVLTRTCDRCVVRPRCWARAAGGSAGVWLVVAAVGCAGCYDPALKDCTVRCRSGTGCPSPLTCQPSGFCARDLTCPLAPGNDDGGPDSSANDGPGPSLCDPLLPFGPSVLVRGINAGVASDRTPRLSADELTLYFASDRGGSTQLYVAQRASRAEDFGAPALISELVSQGGGNQCPSLTPDALTMYFEGTPNGFQIFKSTRGTSTSHWSMPMLVRAVTDVLPVVGGPWITPSGNLYFHSYQTSTLGTASLEIFVAQPGTDDFETPQPVMDIDTDYDEQRPVLSGDELTMFYASTRPDGGALGSSDIWVATRGSRDDSFASPTNVHELNTAAYETPGWLSPDGCRIYFDRAASVSRIYVAERPGPAGTGDIQDAAAAP